MRAETAHRGDGHIDHTVTVYIMDKQGRSFGTIDRHKDNEAQLAKLRRAAAG